MEIEPTPASDHLVGIYGRLPDEALAVEEARIREAVADLAGKLIAITQIRETSNEYSISA